MRHSVRDPRRIFVDPGGRERRWWALPRVPSDEPEIVIDVALTLRDLVGRDIVVLRDLRFGPMPPPDDAIVCVAQPHP